MLKYAAGLTLLLAFSVPVRAGELDNERPAQATPAPAVRHAPPADLTPAAGGSEMDQEAFQQDWFFCRPWGWGWGWGGGWGCYRPWGFGGWGWGAPVYSYGWGGYPAFGWGYRVGYCW